MKTNALSILLICVFFTVCENVGIVGNSQLTEPYDLKIRKVTENQSQFGIYHYDEELNNIYAPGVGLIETSGFRFVLQLKSAVVNGVEFP